jgi:hypothetical protein
MQSKTACALSLIFGASEPFYFNIMAEWPIAAPFASNKRTSRHFNNIMTMTLRLRFGSEKSPTL